MRLRTQRILASSGMAVFFSIIVGGYFFPSLGATQEYDYLQNIFGLTPDAAEVLVFLMRKLGHLVGYAFLCWSFIILLPSKFKSHSMFSILVTAGIASFDEYLQSRVAWRSGQVQDVVLDLVGAFIIVLIVRRGRRKKEKPLRADEPR